MENLSVQSNTPAKSAMLGLRSVSKITLPSASVFEKSKLEISEREEWAASFAQLDPLDKLVQEKLLLVQVDSPHDAYIAEIVKAVLGQCDSARSAVVKRACESLVLLVVSYRDQVSSPCYQELIKRLLKISASRMALIPAHAYQAIVQIVQAIDDLGIYSALLDTYEALKLGVAVQVSQLVLMTVKKLNWTLQTFKHKHVVQSLVKLLESLRFSNHAIVKRCLSESILILNEKAVLLNHTSEFMENIKCYHPRKIFIGFLDMCKAENAIEFRVSGEDICKKSSIPIESLNTAVSNSLRAPSSSSKHPKVLDETLVSSPLGKKDLVLSSHFLGSSAKNLTTSVKGLARSATKLLRAATLRVTPMKKSDFETEFGEELTFSPVLNLKRQLPASFLSPIALVCAETDLISGHALRDPLVDISFEIEKGPRHSAFIQPRDNFLLASPTTIDIETGPSEFEEAKFAENLQTNNAVGECLNSMEPSSTSSKLATPKCNYFAFRNSICSPTPICHPDEASFARINELLSSRVLDRVIFDCTLKFGGFPDKSKNEQNLKSKMQKLSEFRERNKLLLS